MKRDPRDVSVIIPAYNAAATIERALASVSAQNNRPKEVILVDDGSADGTVAMAKKFESNLGDINLIVHEQENLGPGAARNHALGQSGGELVAFLDADDEWLPEKLEKSLGWMDEYELGLVAHNGWLSQEGRESLVDIASRFQAAQPNLFHGLYRRGFISTSSVVVERSLIMEAGGFDESLRTGQDFDLWLRLAELPEFRMGVFETPLTRYHVRRESVTRQTGQRLKDTLTIAYRHAHRLKRHPGASLGSVIFRITALYREAIFAHTKSCRILPALGTILQVPFGLLRGASSLKTYSTYRIQSPFAGPNSSEEK